jgi:hypothetical protein
VRPPRTAGTGTFHHDISYPPRLVRVGDHAILCSPGPAIAAVAEPDVGAGGATGGEGGIELEVIGCRGWSATTKLVIEGMMRASPWLGEGGGSEGWATSEEREEAESKPANEWTVKPTTPCDVQRVVQPIVQYGPFHRAPLKKKWLLFLLILVD